MRNITTQLPGMLTMQVSRVKVDVSTAAPCFKPTQGNSAQLRKVGSKQQCWVCLQQQRAVLGCLQQPPAVAALLAATCMLHDSRTMVSW
jgi:hypothetical protein